MLVVPNQWMSRVEWILTIAPIAALIVVVVAVAIGGLFDRRK